MGQRRRFCQSDHAPSVVFVSGPGLAQLRAGLVDAASPARDAPLHQRGFIAWLQGAPTAVFEELAAVASRNLDSAGDRSARDVATLGFAALALGQSSAFQDGMDWLGRRSWFHPQRPPTLEADGVAAMGIALALAKYASASPDWFTNLVTRSTSLPLAPLSRTLFIAAAHVVNTSGKLDQGEMLPEARLVFDGYGGITASEDVYSAAWERLRMASYSANGEIDASLKLKAFDLVVEHNIPARAGKLEPSDVVKVLSGVSRSMRRWTWEGKPKTPNSQAICWDIQNEYHVQNLLYAVLAPVFSDLNDEETIPPVGQKNPRLDLTIPSIKTIVEVKFLRPGVSMQKMIDEIATDVGLYKTDPRWTTLIPFIWDDSARTEEHSKLISGLRMMEMVVDAVVIPRPGKMQKRP